MRLEGSWRPIVTVEIDEHNEHETILVPAVKISTRGRSTFNLYVLICFFYHCLLWPTFSLSLFFFSDQATRSSILQVNVWQHPRNPK